VPNTVPTHSKSWWKNGAMASTDVAHISSSRKICAISTSGAGVSARTSSTFACDMSPKYRARKLVWLVTPRGMRCGNALGLTIALTVGVLGLSAAFALALGKVTRHADRHAERCAARAAVPRDSSTGAPSPRASVGTRRSPVRLNLGTSSGAVVNAREDARATRPSGPCGHGRPPAEAWRSRPRTSCVLHQLPGSIESALEALSARPALSRISQPALEEGTAQVATLGVLPRTKEVLSCFLAG